MGQRPLVMWSAVCSAPHSQLSFVDNPQRSMLAPNLPTPVRSLFSRVQARRDRPTPCPLFDGVGMNLCSLVVVDAHDSAHLACVQCFTVSCGEQRTLVVEHGEREGDVTLVSFGGWNFPRRRVVDDHIGTRDGLTPVLQLPASKLGERFQPVLGAVQPE